MLNIFNIYDGTDSDPLPNYLTCSFVFLKLQCCHLLTIEISIVIRNVTKTCKEIRKCRQMAGVIYSTFYIFCQSHFMKTKYKVMWGKRKMTKCIN